MFRGWQANDDLPPQKLAQAKRRIKMEERKLKQAVTHKDMKYFLINIH